MQELRTLRPQPPARKNELKTIFEDPHLIVLSKPAGLLSQGEHRGDENLVDLLRHRWGRNYVGLVHRLDRNTSGIMVVAKRTKSAQRLTLALQTDKMQRTYLGWVEGTLLSQVTWQHSLEKNQRLNQVQVVPRSTRTGGKAAKLSALTATPLQRGFWKQTPVTLVQFVLETGRSHQIRVQSAYEGHPLLGDPKYKARDLGFPRVALHSFQLEFPHPMSGEILTFQDPLPADMNQICLDKIVTPS